MIGNLDESYRDSPAVDCPVDFMPSGSENWSCVDHDSRLTDFTTVDDFVCSDSDWAAGDGDAGEEDEVHPWETMEVEQRQLSQQWAEVLGIDEATIKPNDHFFKLGGDSMTAMRLRAAVQEHGRTVGLPEVFENPTLADMARVLFSTQKSDTQKDENKYTPFSLFDDPSEGIWGEILTQCGVLKDQIDDVLPCTSLQTAIMAFSCIRPQSYVEEHVYELPLGWSSEAFEKSWRLVEQLNPALRTRIVKVRSSEWLQVIVKLGAHWSTIDNVETYLERGRAVAMGLGHPLVRVAYLKSSSETPPRLALIIHHAIEDGWSMAMLPHYLDQAYNGAAVVNPAGFQGFVQWMLRMDDVEMSNYWQSQLQGSCATPFPRLPNPSCRPHGQAVINETFDFVRQSQISMTFPILVRAAWALVLARHTDNSDVIFGATLAGRNIPLANAARIFGPMITTVPIRIKVDLSMKISKFLDKLQQQSVEMIRYEQYGTQKIGKLSDELQVACQFQNLLIVHPDHEHVGSASGIVELFSSRENHLPYALTLECRAHKDRLDVKICYDNSVISEWLSKRLLYQFMHVLRQLSQEAAGSTLLLGEVDLASPQDKAEIYTWNQVLPRTIDACLHDVISLRVKDDPNLTAIDSWDGSMSYGELDDMSTKFAMRLHQAGVATENFVPLCFEKSLWTIVAMLAVLKAGGAFCLLDPKQPQNRLRYITETIGAQLIVTSPETASLGSAIHNNIFVVGDGVIANDSSQENVFLPPTSSPNAAYIAFTSGSTGMPKGTVIEHRSCVSGFQAQIDSGYFLFKPRVLQFTSYSFDTSIEEILTTLMAGGCICVPSEADRMTDLSTVVNNMSVDLVEITASAMQLLDPLRVPNLKILRQGGEPMSQIQIQRWADCVQLENSYGPSECCVTSSISRLTLTSDPSNIGKGVGCLYWVVEPSNSNRLAPLGCVGELLIQGPTVGRGYLKRDEENGRSFITSNFIHLDSDQEVGPTYKTGDLVRYNADGTVSIIGRKDSQVKLRGQRIELGEVEHHILRSPGITAAMVVLCKTGHFKDRLVAIVQPQSCRTTRSGQSETVRAIPVDLASEFDSLLSRIVDNLQYMLPSYMIPSSFIIVEGLPMLVSGKTDRGLVQSWLCAMNATQKLSIEIPVAFSMIDKVHHLTDPFAQGLSQHIAELVAGADQDLAKSLRNKNFNLQSAGLDSITIISLIKLINEKYDVELGVATLMNRSLCVGNLAALIEAQVGGKPEVNGNPLQIDFFSELLSLKQTLLQPIEGKISSSICVTGATGYLGTQILHQALLSNHTDRVVAHVRAKSVREAEQKIIKAAKIAKWWDEKFRVKLEIWLGDLSKKWLGLSRRRWNQLRGADPNDSCNITSIIHNGAVVNWYHDYHELKATNVNSTVDILRAAQSSPAIRTLIYVSGGPTWEAEEEESEKSQIQKIALGSGYEQTKVMSELLVKDFAQNNVNSRTSTLIVKPGFIIGDAYDGISNTDDFLWRMVSTVIELEAVSTKDLNRWIFATPGASIAEDIIHYVESKPSSPSATVKVLQGIKVQELWQLLRDNFGYVLQEKDHSMWMELLTADVERRKRQHVLWPVFHFVQHGYDTLGCKQPPSHILPPYSRNLAVRNAFICNIKYLIEIGYLPDAKGQKVSGNTRPRFSRSC